MKKVFYFGDFTTSFSVNQFRTQSLAGTQKMSYLIKIINKIGYSVQVVSPSWTHNTFGFFKGSNVKYQRINFIRYFFSFGDHNIKFLKYIKCGMTLIFAFFYLFFNMRKEDVLIVYHSVEYMSLINILRRIKKIILIYEVEELYGSLSYYSTYRSKEIVFLKEQHKFIFASDMLPKLLEKTSDSYVVYYGAYSVSDIEKKRFNDDKIHIVYAGTFDEEKGGAYSAIYSAMSLDDSYILHILGFGNDEQTEKIKQTIIKVNKLSKCKVKYEGSKMGEEYHSFLSMCDVGLSCQKTSGEYNDTSFPSKILVYLSFDLGVVVTDIPVLRESKLKEYLTFSKTDAPRDIAEAIKKCKKKSFVEKKDELEQELLVGISKMLK